MIINHFKPLIKKLSAACALAFIVFVLFAPVKIAFAAAGSCDPKTTPGCDYLPLTTIPGAFTANTPTDPIKVITNIYGVAIGIAAVLAVGMITWAGIQYATTEAITGKSDAKGHWEGAIWGLVILLGSYIMLRTINVDLVNLNLDLTPITPTTTVGSNALSDLQNTVDVAAQKTAASYQDDQSAVKAAQNNLDTMLGGTKVQIDTWTAQLASLDPQDASVAAQRADLISKIDTANKQINNAQAALSVAQASAAVSTVNAAVAKSLSDVSKYASEGDIAGAQKVLDANNDTISREVAAVENSAATPEVKKKVRSQEAVATQLGKQTIQVYQNLNDIKSALDANTRADIMAEKSIKAHQDFLAYQDNMRTQLKTYGAPDDVLKNYDSQTLVQLHLLDSGLPITQQCSTGHYVYSGKSIVCAN